MFDFVNSTVASLHFNLTHERSEAQYERSLKFTEVRDIMFSQTLSPQKHYEGV